MEPDEFINREYMNDPALKRMMRDIRGKRVLNIGCGERLGTHWSPDCGIMRCAHGRGLLACSRCPEFMCPDLGEFYATGYGKAKETALRQLEVGLEAWWKEHGCPSRELAMRRAYTEREDSA